MNSAFSRFRMMALAGVMGILPLPLLAQQQPAAQPAAPAAVPPPPIAVPAAPAAPAVVAPARPAAPPAPTIIQVPEGMRVGAVVQLPSGGPKMTVVAISGANAKTQWQEEKTGKLSSGDFPLVALKVVKADSEEEDDEDEDEDDEEEDDKSKK